MRRGQILSSHAIHSQQRNPPLINLSSSEDSDSDSEKENHCNESLHTTHTLKPPGKSPTYPNSHSQKPINPLQFSTLSLEEGSIADFDQQMRALMAENK